MAKHYIITDESGRVLRGFSDDFEQPDANAICICENGGRHFELNGSVNPLLISMNGVPLYKYAGGVVIARTPEEITADTVIPEPVKTFEERLAAVETLVSGSPSYGELLEAVNILLGETP